MGISQSKHPALANYQLVQEEGAGRPQQLYKDGQSGKLYHYKEFTRTGGLQSSFEKNFLWWKNNASTLRNFVCPKEVYPAKDLPSGLCQEKQSVGVLFPRLSRSLLSERIARHPSRHHFSEEELLVYYRDCLQALASLYENSDLYHGKISSAMVSLESGQAYLVAPVLTTADQNQNILKHGKTDVFPYVNAYISLQRAEELGLDKKQAPPLGVQHLPPTVAEDIYSLSLCFAEAGLLRPLQYLSKDTLQEKRSCLNKELAGLLPMYGRLHSVISEVMSPKAFNNLSGSSLAHFITQLLNQQQQLPSFKKNTARSDQSLYQPASSLSPTNSLFTNSLIIPKVIGVLAPQPQGQPLLTNPLPKQVISSKMVVAPSFSEPQLANSRSSDLAVRTTQASVIFNPLVQQVSQVQASPSQPVTSQMQAGPVKPVMNQAIPTKQLVSQVQAASPTRQSTSMPIQQIQPIQTVKPKQLSRPVQRFQQVQFQPVPQTVVHQQPPMFKKEPASSPVFDKPDSITFKGRLVPIKQSSYQPTQPSTNARTFASTSMIKPQFTQIRSVATLPMSGTDVPRVAAPPLVQTLQPPNNGLREWQAEKGPSIALSKLIPVQPVGISSKVKLSSASVDPKVINSSQMGVQAPPLSDKKKFQSVTQSPWEVYYRQPIPISRNDFVEQKKQGKKAVFFQTAKEVFGNMQPQLVKTLRPNKSFKQLSLHYEHQLNRSDSSSAAGNMSQLLNKMMLNRSMSVQQLDSNESGFSQCSRSTLKQTAFEQVQFRYLGPVTPASDDRRESLLAGVPSPSVLSHSQPDELNVGLASAANRSLLYEVEDVSKGELPKKDLNIIICRSEQEPEENSDDIDLLTNRMRQSLPARQDQSYYEGDLVDGLSHGQGVYHFSDGSVYEGDWNEGKIEGIGKLYYPNGRLAYEGEWVNGYFEGSGTFYNLRPKFIQEEIDFTDLDSAVPYFTHYEGNFDNGNRHGVGKVYYSNGEAFWGTFAKGKATGPGSFFTKWGKRVEGQWEDNRLTNCDSCISDQQNKSRSQMRLSRDSISISEGSQYEARLTHSIVDLGTHKTMKSNDC